MKSVVQEASTIGKAIEQGWKTAGEPREFSIKVLEIPQHNFLGFTTKSAKVAIVFEENAPREGFQRGDRRDIRDRDQRSSREPRRDNRERDSRDNRERDSRDWRDSSSRSERPPRDRERTTRDSRDESRDSRDSRSRDRRDRFKDRDQVRDQNRDQGREQNREQRDSIRDNSRPVRHFSQQPTITEPADFSEIEQKPFIAPTQSIVAEALAPQQGQAGKQIGQWDDELVASAKTWLTDTLRHMDLGDVTFTIEPQNFHLRITLSKPLIDDETKEKHLFASLSTLMIASLKKEFRKALRGHKIVIVHG